MKTSVPGSEQASDERVRRYLTNLGVLYRHDPGLAAQIDALPFAQTPPLETARDGHATVRLEADNGRTVYVHSRYRPLEEARKFVEGLTQVENPTFVIAGLGLGYHLPELERRFDRPVLIVAEDNLGLIKAAFCTVDLSRLIGAGRVIFLTAAEKPHLHEKLTACNADLMLGMHFVTLPHAKRYHERFHAQVRGLLTDFVSYSQLQMVTLLKIARVTCKNVLFNLSDYLASPDIEQLRGRAAGFPAIVVAAGPSLARNIDQLGELRERAVVIAVQTVFKPLLALGHTPHFVTSLDYHAVSAEFFRGLKDVGDCILVAEPKATWGVLDLYPGRAYVLSHPFVEDFLREVGPARAGLKAGSTVAHLAFYLAQHLGCDPVIFVGQDLCYSDGLYYPPGMPIEKTWRPELGRFQTVEMKQWERIVRNRPILRVVKDIRGQDTYTDNQLFTYAEQFQSDFLSSPQRIIHAGESGMRLAGTEVMPLRTAAEKFCTRPLPGDLFADRPPAAGEWKTRAVGALESRLVELREVKDIAVEMRGLLAKLVGLVSQPREFNRVVVRVDELRTLVQRHERTYKLVLNVSQLAELRRHTADRRLGEPEQETPDTARQRLARDQEFVDAFIDGCEYLEGVLPDAVRRLQERLP
jgi:hypothetical protein